MSELARPFISVIVIVHNDARRLPRALKSLEVQTFRDFEVIVVDDGSTDGSAQLATEWANENNARVVLRETCSGGCGAPRNDGIRNARGTYLAFLDSDDEYLEDGLEVLAQAAEGKSPDIVSFGVQRTNDTSGETKLFNAKYYSSTGRFSPFTDRHDHFFDAIVPAKLIRRELLEHNGYFFPEDLKYEDQLMSAQLWRTATSVVVGSTVVYDWHYGDREARKSISSSRSDIQNLLDRLEVHRRIDAYLADEPRLAQLKMEKFFEHDLSLYLRELVFQPQEYQTKLQVAVREYLSAVTQDLVSDLQPQHLLVYRVILDGTLTDLIEVARFVYQRGSAFSGLLYKERGFLWTFGNSRPHNTCEITKFTRSLMRRNLLTPWAVQVIDVRESQETIELTIKISNFQGTSLRKALPKKFSAKLCARESTLERLFHIRRIPTLRLKDRRYKLSLQTYKLEDNTLWDGWLILDEHKLRMPLDTKLLSPRPSYATHFGRYTFNTSMRNTMTIEA